MRNRRARRRRLIGLAAAAAAVLGTKALVRGAAGPDTLGAAINRYEIDSRLVKRPQAQTAVVPDGAGGRDRRPLLVFLHGRGNDQDANLDEEMFAALDTLGG